MTLAFAVTLCFRVFLLAGSKGLEPSASGVTGRRYNQLNYDPIVLFWWAKQGSNL